ncbi:hypothetical protein F4820DRAFT_214303 [Hypoxylon rubiginosum]|uniref:Uncharacterized protein n=1 Tax=Hypoxylon rubiginosum TaxID=110542 RepID=A0ACB9Z6N8_9PEZI|nr:hypothetical protein F4820DRAFT_214303 [Hypoxylon rubiginosum]
MLFSALSLLTSAAAVSATALPSSFSSSSSSAAAAPAKRASGSISVTPHDKFASSLGVLGCKINTNRVAYWPEARGCDDLCVKVSANGRSVNLLVIDHSGGAHDISYDAWNYLVTGRSATDDPTQGGGIPATWEDVPMSECADLITEPTGRLAFSAPTGMNTVGSCLGNAWFAENYVLYNIYTSQCTFGYDEVCTLEGNLPQCGHTLGETAVLTTQPVYNIDYGTGKLSLAA